MNKLLISLYLFSLNSEVMANLTTTARNLTKKTQDLGKVLIGLFIVWVGYLYISGNERAREKAMQLALGTFFILAGRSILVWLQSAIR